MKKHKENHFTSEEENEEQAPPESSLTEEQNTPVSEKAEAGPETELADARDKYLRLYSDFENYKKRVSRERIEWTKMAGADIFLSILPVMDDMERAMKAMNESGDKKEAEGWNLIYNKMKSITEAKGLKAMESIGKTFDVELHDAITNVPAPSPDLKGKVVDEVEKGYYLNDKVLRHAKVIVGN